MPGEALTEREAPLLLTTYTVAHALHARTHAPSHVARARPRQVVNLGHVAGIRSLLNAGALTAMVMAMNYHLSQPDLQQRAASALGKIAMIDEACRNAVVDSGAIKALVRAMEVNAEVAVLGERACNALACIAAGSVPYKLACVHAGAVGGVSAMMIRHKGGWALLQAAGCAVFAGIAAGCLECKRAVASQGASAIAQALDANDSRASFDENHPGIKTHGCVAIGLVSYGDGECVSRLVAAGCVRCIVQLIRRHPTDAHLVQSVVGAIANVTSGDHAARAVS